MLKVEKLCSGYGRIRVLYDVSLEVKRGEIVALIGSNGAGKTTLLRSLSGVHPITGGSIQFEGQAIQGLSPAARVGLGVSQVPEGRQVFSTLTVEDNLRLGAYLRKDIDSIRDDMDRAYAMFPILAEKRAQDAGNLSGGQQQMLAIARALMARPKLILLDEPSLGLAPLIISQVFDAIRTLSASGVTFLLVDQNAHAALSIADRAYVLENGLISHSGPSEDLLKDPRISDLYLGADVE